MQLSATSAFRLGDALFPLLDEVDKSDTQDPADFAYLHQVEASLAGLVLAHEGLGTVEQLGEFDLCHPGVGACVVEKLHQVPVLCRVDGALHPDSWQSQSGISKVGILCSLPSWRGPE
jgi:hypothetical protein